uniref:Putative ovule protein n=1 Tax=Solanum chacoense TaxID=4108 RepID=A0A0V0GWT1_SOLCH
MLLLQSFWLFIHAKLKLQFFVLIGASLQKGEHFASRLSKWALIFLLFIAFRNTSGEENIVAT